jgi:hypothetical protein
MHGSEGPWIGSACRIHDPGAQLIFPGLALCGNAVPATKKTTARHGRDRLRNFLHATTRHPWRTGCFEIPEPALGGRSK